MNDKYDGVRRLFQAATGKNTHLPSDDEYRAQIPALVDAEMAGENIASLFPDLLAHLDTCPTCDAEYAALLELAMAEEGGELPQPNNFPPLRLPGKVAFQRLVRQIAQSI